jgi:predicted nucleotidyltransferase
VDDDAFLDHVADRLGNLPGVEAVNLGGSRAEGTHQPDSDWDFGIYYRGHFDPQTLRDIGWPGEVSEVGGWSKGVFNGGAWLEIDGRRSDVHYRDLDTIDREIDAAREGRFRIEPLMFHLAGIPSYLVLAELAGQQVLHGQLPTPDYPAALRERATRQAAAPVSRAARAPAAEMIAPVMMLPTGWFRSRHQRRGRTWRHCREAGSAGPLGYGDGAGTGVALIRADCRRRHRYRGGDGQR